MHFGPWFSLAEAVACAPDVPGVVQLRAAAIFAYAKGQSAMVYYTCSPAAESLRKSWAVADRSWWRARRSTEPAGFDSVQRNAPSASLRACCRVLPGVLDRRRLLMQQLTISHDRRNVCSK